jgi:hypothetical protein
MDPVSKRTSRFIDREFQLRYVSIVVIAAAFGMLVSIGPAYYFLNQNYQIFVDLAFDNSPDLLANLQRERYVVNVVLMCGISATLLFFGLLSFKMTNRMTGPLKVLRNHLKWLSRGRWSQPPLKVRESDEFQDLIEAYNYFYSSFRANLYKDLERLKSFNIDSHNRDAYKAWLQMIEEKSLQLQLKTETPLSVVKSGPSASNAESPDSRRVS